jgi:hypothetical protein
MYVCHSTDWITRRSRIVERELKKERKLRSTMQAGLRTKQVAVG